MLNNKEIPTKIEYIIEYEDGAEKVTLDVKDMSIDDLLLYAGMGEKAALYELRARIAQNSPEDNTDKI
jgi:hypothetical protein